MATNFQVIRAFQLRAQKAREEVPNRLYFAARLGQSASTISLRRAGGDARSVVRARSAERIEELCRRSPMADFEVAARIRQQKAVWGVVAALSSAVVLGAFVLLALCGPMIVARTMQSKSHQPPAIEKVEKTTARR